MSAAERTLVQIDRPVEMETPHIRTRPRSSWKGATLGLWMGTALTLTITIVFILLPAGAVAVVAGALAMLLAVSAVGSLLALLLTLISRLPFAYRAALGAGLALTALIGMVSIVFLAGIAVVSVTLGAGFSLLGAGLYGLKSEMRRGRAFLLAGSGGLLLALTLAWLLSPGMARERAPLAANDQAPVPALALPDPSLPGAFAVTRTCYASPDGRRSDACFDAPAVVTQPVDGSAFVEGWSGLRRAYWGFGPEALPLNARVWLPQGEGPFPLVLIVHGNAMMEKPSHDGYAYLAELLASRGFVVASVDQNFLNLSFAADMFMLNNLKEENDARGWLLLEHLRLWHAWNSDPASPFYHKVDLGQIALVGHSRGGEAVAAAAAFNRMLNYPGDARVAFDYGYAIQSIAAIAPVDGQYIPAGMRLPLLDLNYLVLQGAHDMDVVYYMGARQYERAAFSGEDFRFKAGVYIDGANHGQFNTRWGRKDFGEPIARFFNLRQIMPADDQMRIAQVYLSAFLEATLRGERGYLPLFQNYRGGNAWLPEGIHVSQYMDSSTLLLSGYQEDVDPSTATLAGASLSGENLTMWQERIIPARYGSSENRAVYLGWQPGEGEASYEIRLPDGLDLDDKSALVFAIAGTNEDPCPDADCRKMRSSRYQAPEVFDVTVEVSDAAGNTARLPLSRYAALRPPLATALAKPPFKIVLPESEIVLQHYQLALDTFRSENPAFDPARLRSVRLVFDGTAEGVIVLDNIGLRQEP